MAKDKFRAVVALKTAAGREIEAGKIFSLTRADDEDGRLAYWRRSGAVELVEDEPAPKAKPKPAEAGKPGPLGSKVVSDGN